MGTETSSFLVDRATRTAFSFLVVSGFCLSISVSFVAVCSKFLSEVKRLPFFLGRCSGPGMISQQGDAIFYGDPTENSPGLAEAVGISVEDRTKEAEGTVVLCSEVVEVQVSGSESSFM
jgi:hypothetical protein